MGLFQGTPKDSLFGLINSNNTLPIAVDEDHLYLGNPRLDTDGVTTILPTTAMLGREYRGYATFQYRRMDLSKAFDVRPLITAVGAATLHKMLDVVNAALGLSLTVDDVVDTDISTVGGGERVNINLQTTPTSLGYVGALVITYVRLRPNLTDVVKDTELQVLRHKVDPAVAKVDLDLWMWNKDFSGYTDTIKVRNNTWVSQPAVKAMMLEEFGFDDWPAPQVNGVKDYATSDYPGANTNFQRVVVQTGALGATYQGNALFHYNLSN